MKPGRYLQQLREKKPLVHHITNQVTMEFLANGVLAIGGSPIMVHHPGEVKEAVAASDALVLNMGTLSSGLVEAMTLAGEAANQKGIPVVLDPVGVGLSSLRRRAWLSLNSRLKLSALCGNAAEISFLVNETWQGKGVDTGSAEADVELAVQAARQLKTLVVITGKHDLISDGEQTFIVKNGDEWLTRVTGTGCLSTSLVASFLSVEEGNPAEKAAAALVSLGVAAEKARPYASGPGTFRTLLLDQLFRLNAETLENGMRVEVKGG
ncbi:MAG: hydroxyethylthiazole kinase [Bacillaceae bacterium]|nr:hydroxyethylthiazole kinase [Bacillaceae bacterium]